MSRRNQIWTAVFLTVATLAVLFAVGRSRREPPAAIAQPLRPAQLAAPPPLAADIPTVTPAEQPLPAWVRVAVVAAAMLAFFVVSLVARRNA